MENIKKMIPYLFVILLAFYIIPFLIVDTGSGIAVLLIIVPMICFINAIIYGIKHSFHALYTILVCLLFIPTIYIFYNTSAWVYVIGYGVLSLLGNIFGILIYKVFKSFKL